MEMPKILKTIVIDGHNLIPKISGFRLEDLDDEIKLIGLLSDYCRLSQTQIELFFDGAPPGYRRETHQGPIHIHHIRIGLKADDAIIAFLRSAGKNARNILVVTSDHRVQVESRALHARVMSSEQFSQEIKKALSSPQAIQEEREKHLTDTEVEEWEKIFKSKK